MNFSSKYSKISDFSGFSKDWQANFSKDAPTKNNIVVKANSTNENRKVK
jgi:hypothetical protein